MVLPTFRAGGSELARAVDTHGGRDTTIRGAAGRSGSAPRCSALTDEQRWVDRGKDSASVPRQQLC